MKVFDSGEFEKHKTEVKEKWGQTTAYKEYKAKTKDYSKYKFNELSEGIDHIMMDFSLCMRSGETPDSDKAQGLVKKLQGYITENYYLCTNDILVGLGQMYICDERFKNFIDKHASGTAEYIYKAIAEER